MYDFTLPDYQKNSIINLMSSITQSFGKKHLYKELPLLSSKKLKHYNNVVLIVIDGLGDKYLKKQKKSYLAQKQISTLTSTFLATTACANTAFLVGYPPQQHALTGWDIKLKEVGAITTILRFTPIYKGETLDKSGFKMEDIMDIEALHKGFDGDCYIMMDKKICTSPFSQYVGKEAEIIATRTKTNTFTKIKEVVNKTSTKRKFIYAYVPEFDSLAHVEGPRSKKVEDIFHNIDRQVQKLVKSLKGTNTMLIITADHGFIQTSPKTELWMEDFAGLKECLTIPLAGEPRVRDCFVRPQKVKEFEHIVSTKMNKYCWCYKGEQLIHDHFYGLGKANPRLFDRVGDYVLIMKENYILRDRLANYKAPREFHKGNHGGVSEQEMLVPLILIDC